MKLKPVIFAWVLTASPALWGEPAPGDVFREYTYSVRFSELDPGSTREGIEQLRERSLQERALDIDDLKDATKAEAVVEYWGGHIGTSDQKFRLNQADWIHIPQPVGTPTQPQCYYRTLLKATVPIPLSQLKSGTNRFQFTAGPQLCHGFNWGFYWVYAFTVRVYYSSSKPHPTGTVISPGNGSVIGDLPRLVATAESTHSTISKVDFIAHYEDINREGDGFYRQWHYYFEQGRIRGHVGSAESPPYAVVWDNRWVPDQDEPIRVAARITDSLGMTHMTPDVSLTLRRSDRSVKMYKPSGVPENFGVRVGRRKTCQIDVPDDLSNAREIRLVLSTWSAAHDGEIGLNDTRLRDRIGVIHNYSFDSIPVPGNVVKKGSNTFYIASPTQHHAAEVNWPGPILLIEFREPVVVGLAEQEIYGEQPGRKWWDLRWRYRIPLRVEANGHERRDRPAEVDIDFTKTSQALGLPGVLEDKSLRVIEVNAQGELLDENVRFQFDRVEASTSKSTVGGSLIWLLRGVTPERSARHFFVYFDSAGKFGTAPESRLVGPVETLQYEGQETFKIGTRGATYFYHKDGAGLASLLDKDGNDWISYHPGGRSAGEFRGIPNLGAFAHPGYSGDKGARSQVLHQGPLKITVISENSAKTWVTRWEFYPDYARMTVRKNETPYWFLYEGTPGGKLDEEADFHVLSDGLRRSNKEHWSGDIPGPEWIYFGDSRLKRMLYLVNHQHDDATDQFWPMEGNMTVFGFGRQYRCCGRYLSVAPASFTIGFGEDSEFSAASQTINAAYQDLSILVGMPERRKTVRKLP